jgi:HK97 family phage major capsid protein
MEHTEQAHFYMEQRDAYTEDLRRLNPGNVTLTGEPAERERRLLERISESDESMKRHLEAAAAEAVGQRARFESARLAMSKPTNREDRKADMSPGELMARSLEVSRGITTAGTGKAFSPEEMARSFVDLLAPQSVVMESGVQRVETEAETYSFPVVRSDFSAGFVGELDDLPTGGFGADPLKVTPRKIAAADLIANELMADGGPEFLNPIARSLMRSVALGFDREALIGDGSGNGFAGIASTPGIQTHTVTGGLADLDPFVSAFGLLESANARATAIVMAPQTWAGLLALRETSGSLKPLLSESAGSPTAGVQRSILGVPVWLSSFMARTDILVYEADQIFAVWRKEAGFEISNQAGFLKDGTAVRAIARAVIAVPNAAAVCKISISERKR